MILGFIIGAVAFLCGLCVLVKLAEYHMIKKHQEETNQEEVASSENIITEENEAKELPAKIESELTEKKAKAPVNLEKVVKEEDGDTIKEDKQGKIVTEEKAEELEMTLKK
ncbi:MAG: hypothetical protein IKR12_02820 [Clostridia bacterium]|nr:hypothetical protein [Clostridia bacterium]